MKFTPDDPIRLPVSDRASGFSTSHIVPAALVLGALVILWALGVRP